MNFKDFLKLPASKYSIRTIVSWLWGAWRGNRLQAILNASIGLLDVAVSLAQVWAVKNAIDVAAGTIDGNIYVAVAIFGILILASFALSISAIWVRNILGIKAQNQMQRQLLDRMLRAEWHGKESRHSGDVLNRLETDVNVVVDFLAETIPNTLSVLALFIGAFWYLFSMDAMLAIVTIAIIPLFILLSKLYVRQMRNLTRTVRNSDSKVQSVLQETIQNRMLIKTLESGDAMVGKLAGTQQELRQNVVRKTTFSVFSNLILNVGFAAGYLVAFLWAAIRLSQHTLTFGGMTAFLQLVNKIQGPARNLTKLVPAFVSVLTAAERLMELEEDPMEEQGDSIPMEAPCGIRFDNVSYAYDNEEQLTINSLSFDFKPGSCTALLGETGAGKTTIVRMILALLKPKSGAITIYNKKVEQQLSPLLRCNLVYVPQGNTLMSGTIRDNLLLGKPFVKVSTEDFLVTRNARGIELKSAKSQKVTVKGKTSEYNINMKFSPSYDLSQVTVQNLGDRSTLDVYYDNWLVVNTHRFPKNVKIIIKTDRTDQILIENTKFDLTRMATPFSVPENYNKTMIR